MGSGHYYYIASSIMSGKHFIQCSIGAYTLIGLEMGKNKNVEDIS